LVSREGFGSPNLCCHCSPVIFYRPTSEFVKMSPNVIYPQNVDLVAEEAASTAATKRHGSGVVVTQSAEKKAAELSGSLLTHLPNIDVSKLTEQQMMDIVEDITHRILELLTGNLDNSFLDKIKEMFKRFDNFVTIMLRSNANARDKKEHVPKIVNDLKDLVHQDQKEGNKEQMLKFSNDIIMILESVRKERNERLSELTLKSSEDIVTATNAVQKERKECENAISRKRPHEGACV